MRMKLTTAIKNRNNELRDARSEQYRCMDVLPGESFDGERALETTARVKRCAQSLIGALKAQKRKEARELKAIGEVRP